MKKLFLSLLLASAILTVQAQSWQVDPTGPSIDFFTLRDSAQAYFEKLPDLKGTGYKQFKRWEWFWQQRVGKSGKFPLPHHLYHEWLKLKAGHVTARSLAGNVNWVSQGQSASGASSSGIGRLTCIAFHPTQANTFWVGAATGGLWKTTDGGITWTTTTDNLPVIGVSAIAVHPSNPNIIYIASDMYPAMHVLKSVDGGNTWQPTVPNWSSTPQPAIKRLIIDPVNPQILLAATSSGVHRSSNGGLTWTSYLSPLIFSDIEFKPGNSNTVYAATTSYPNSSIYISNNGGITWVLAATLTGVKRIDLAVSPANPTNVQAVGVALDNGFAGLWNSSNSGANFLQYVTGTCSNNYLGFSNQSCGGQGWYDLALAISPINANEMWLGGVHTWHSTNGGTTWSLTGSVNHDDKHFFAYHPLNSSVMFECNDGGLYKTTDAGVTWTDLSSGLVISQLYRIGATSLAKNMVVCGLQDNGTKLKKASAWSNIRGADGMECFIDYTDTNIIYATVQFGLISKSTDGGQQWNIISKNYLSGPDGAGAWITPVIMHPSNNNTLLMGKNGLYTSNGGTLWTQIAPNYNFGVSITSIAYAPSNPQVIYVTDGNTLHKTVNAGSTWTAIVTSTDNITSITVHPADPQTVWITLSGYTPGNRILMSTNGGGTWSSYSAGLPAIPVNCMIYQLGSNNTLYVGTDLGVFYRDASATSWTPYGSGLPNVVVTDLDLSYNNGKLWAATYGRGLWNSDVDCSVVSAPAAISGINSICAGEPVTFSIQTVIGAGSYTWSLPVGWTGASSGNSISVIPSATGNFSVGAVNFCTISAFSTKNLNVFATPLMTLSAIPERICIIGDSAQLTAVGALTYTWSTGENQQSILVNPLFTAEYTVTGTSNQGCTSASTILLLVSNCTDLPEMDDQDGMIIVYPNPSQGEFTVLSRAHFPLNLINIVGELVMTISKETQHNGAVTIKGVAPGVYFLQIADQGFSRGIKVMVMD